MHVRAGVRRRMKIDRTPVTSAPHKRYRRASAPLVRPHAERKSRVVYQRDHRRGSLGVKVEGLSAPDVGHLDPVERNRVGGADLRVTIVA
jgi:hypothetical protein